MRPVPDRSSWHPEDDLPSWVFETSNCGRCDGIIDSYEGHDYAKYDMQMCCCKIVCKECGEIDNMISIEEVIIRFPVYLSDGVIEFDERNGKTIHSEIDHIECAKCQTYYSIEELEEMIE